MHILAIATAIGGMPRPVEGDLGLGDVLGDAVQPEHGFAMTMKAPLVSMQTSLMREASQLCASR